MEKRIEYIDSIRGLAIFLVVMGHAIAWNYGDWQQICVFSPSQPKSYWVGGVVWQVIYSFHMALFFMVSGFLSGVSLVSRENIFRKISFIIVSRPKWNKIYERYLFAAIT